MATIFYADSAGTQGTGTGVSAANACTLKQFLENDVILHTALVADSICYCKNGTTITFDGSGAQFATLAVTGASSTPIRVIGYASTITDGGVVEIRDTNAGATVDVIDFAAREYWHFYNIKFIDILNLNGDATSGHLLYNVEISNGLDNDFMFTGTGDSNVFINCISTSSRGTGYNIQGRASRLYYCKAISSATNGFEVGSSSYGAIVVGCLAYDAGTAGFVALLGECEFINCLADDNGDDGFYLDAQRFQVLINCGATNNGGWGVEGDAGTNGFFLNCGFFQNTSGTINTTNIQILQNIAEQTTDPTFTNQAGRDYTLQAGSPWADAGNGYNG